MGSSAGWGGSCRSSPRCRSALLLARRRAGRALQGRRARRRPGARAGAAASGSATSRARALRTNGRILGFDPREGDYSCSGTALDTPSHSIVLTAGHCVLEHGSVGRDLTFVPAYDHGERPFGTFDVEAAYVMPQWRHGENPDFDVAALQVAPERARRPDRRRRRPRLRHRPLPPRRLSRSTATRRRRWKAKSCAAAWRTASAATPSPSASPGRRRCPAPATWPAAPAAAPGWSAASTSTA